MLTGGGILEQVLRALRDLPGRDAVDWRRVHVWGDERYVASDSDERNDKAALRRGWARCRWTRRWCTGCRPRTLVSATTSRRPPRPMPPNWPRPSRRSQGEDDVPHFDVVLLGVGPDGHCASLFPGHPGVYEQDAAVIAVRDAPKPPPTRLSFTFRALDAANEVWFVASGEARQRPWRWRSAAPGECRCRPRDRADGIARSGWSTGTPRQLWVARPDAGRDLVRRRPGAAAQNP